MSRPRWFLSLAIGAALGSAVLVMHGAAAQSGAPHVVFVTGDDEYRSEVTMPMIAEILEKRHRFRTSVAYARPTPQDNHHIEGLEALDTAEVMVMFTRFRALPEDQLQRILRFVESGKGIVGLRTSTHAFQYPEGHPRHALNDSFGLDVFGQKWITHHGSQSSTTVSIPAGMTHEILTGVSAFPARSWLYHVAPLNGDATVLLEGISVNSNKTAKPEYPPTQPVAWTRSYKQSRVFFTTLGHPEDFAQPSMRRLVINGIYWTLGRAVPRDGAEERPVRPYSPPETFDLSKLPPR